eukprot:SAG31_NODE_60_length_29419_cov_39.876398_17_plen_50_part_00
MPGWEKGLPPRVVRRDHAEGHYVDLQDVNRRCVFTGDQQPLLKEVKSVS